MCPAAAAAAAAAGGGGVWAQRTAVIQEAVIVVPRWRAHRGRLL